MPGKIPQSYMTLLEEMSRGTGIPISVLINQANMESGFRANAVSNAGAEGWLQFLPSTYNQYAKAAGVAPGTEFNPADEAKVYIQFVNALETQFHGNLRDVLAAYNAGPGNIGAGMGYANAILGGRPPTINAPSLQSAHARHSRNQSTVNGGRGKPSLGNPLVARVNTQTGNVTARPGGAGMRTPVGYTGAFNQQTGQVGNDRRPPRVPTTTPGGAGMRAPVPYTTAGAHRAHLIAQNRRNRAVAIGINRTPLQGGKTPPPTNRGNTGGTRIVNR